MRTAEFVTPKHPDKMCDRISDGVLDWALRNDPNARVAIETMGGHGKVFIVGELTMKEIEKHDPNVVLAEIVEKVTGEKLEIEGRIVTQSEDIAKGVDTGGAGDQGIMQGYATRETANFMPIEYELARSLCKFLFEKFPVDGKTQVTVNEKEPSISSKYHGQASPVVLVASFQKVAGETLLEAMREWLRANDYLPGIADVQLYANPAGDWSIGGFEADTGLTGRKLAVDNYGPRYPLGGGAFSGKDATKVDRSAAYMARKIAVEFLENNENFDEAKVRLSYAIGIAEPVEKTMLARRHGADVWEAQDIGDYDLTPNGIIECLNLRAPIFQETAEWGHFGNGNIWK